MIDISVGVFRKCTWSIVLGDNTGILMWTPMATVQYKIMKIKYNFTIVSRNLQVSTLQAHSIKRLGFFPVFVSNMTISTRSNGIH